MTGKHVKSMKAHQTSILEPSLENMPGDHVPTFWHVLMPWCGMEWVWGPCR